MSRIHIRAHLIVQGLGSTLGPSLYPEFLDYIRNDLNHSALCPATCGCTPWSTEDIQRKSSCGESAVWEVQLHDSCPASCLLLVSFLMVV